MKSWNTVYNPTLNMISSRFWNKWNDQHLTLSSCVDVFFSWHLVLDIVAFNASFLFTTFRGHRKPALNCPLILLYRLSCARVSFAACFYQYLLHKSGNFLCHGLQSIEIQEMRWTTSSVLQTHCCTGEVSRRGKNDWKLKVFSSSVWTACPPSSDNWRYFL